MSGETQRSGASPEGGARLSSAHAAIRADKRAARLWQEASQLKSHASETARFFVNAAAVAGSPSPALLSYVETLISVVRLTDQYPYDAVFEMDAPGGRVVVGADGLPRPGRAAEPAVEPRPDGALCLDGLDSTRPIPLSAFVEAYATRRINRSTFEAFLGAPDRVKEDWDCARLRAFYATRGSTAWIPPIDDFVKIDRVLDRIPGAARVRAVILKAMADAGAMGFCPTQYLRRVIMPRVGKDAARPEVLARNAGLLGDCFKFVCEELGSGGDGSAGNLFTLKTLIRPLASPGSRLFDARCYDDPEAPAAADIAFTIGRRWAGLVARGGPYAREVMRGYADGFLESLVRIETPKGILSHSIRLLDHLEFVCALVDSRPGLAAFDKAAHVAGSSILLRRAESSAHFATFLNTLIAHFEAVESFAPGAPAAAGKKAGRPFGREYRRYLACFARGMFNRPEDVRAYVESSAALAGSPSRDSDELLETIMRYAREPEERAMLLGFARECPVFDKAVYLRWRALDEPKRGPALEYLREAHRRYLLEPDFAPDGRAVGLGDMDLETALVKAHANASVLSKREIEGILSSHAGRSLPPIPRAFAEPYRFDISERGYCAEGGAAKHRDAAFIASRIALAHRVAEAAGEAGVREAERARLRDSALGKLASLRAAIAQAAPDGLAPDGREARRLAGLREQAAGLESFAAFVESLAAAASGAGGESANASIDGAVEAGLYFLAGDKAFAKAERDALAAFALGGDLAGAAGHHGPERLSEEPWTTVLSADPEARGFGLAELAALRELWSTTLARAVDSYFHGAFAALPPASSSAARRLFASREPRLAEAPLAGLSDRAARLCSSCAGIGQLDAELAALEGGQARGRRGILLVGARRRLEHFFGYIGELCIARCTQEAFRRDFVPIRVIDLRDMKVVGYVHALLIPDGRPGARREGRPAAVLMAGIEPKTSWMLHFDEAELYRGVREYLVRATRESGASALLYTLQPVAHSNCFAVAKLVAEELRDKPVVRLDRDVRFPEQHWSVLPAARVWPDGPEELPLARGEAGNV